ncbi:MAG TPA: type II secretion system F family protein [Actinomycetota bacterium]|nr:type II secretion system F family protein [Actinomycetota bacterium]
MPKFKYVATNDSGKVVRGTTFAETPEQAEADLRSQRLYDVSVELEGKGAGRKGGGKANNQVPAASGTAPVASYGDPPPYAQQSGIPPMGYGAIPSFYPAEETPSASPPAAAREKKKSFWQIEITQKKVPKTDIMNFSRQLASFIRAGIPILEAIDTFASEARNTTFKDALNDIRVRLIEGDTFSTGVAAQGKIFPRFYVDMLRAAELTGRLDSVLDQLSKYIERDLEARRKIRGAMIYPALIGVMSVGTVILLATFVLPRFKTFFESLNAKLPLTTRMVLASGAFVGHWWWALLTGLGVLIISLALTLNSEWGRRKKDQLLLKIPVLSDVVRFAIIERFCRVLAAMVRAGVPLPEALLVVSESTKNRVYEEALDAVRAEMLEGGGIAGPIQRSALFPAAVTQMVRVGEDTGTLDTQLETASSFYEQELDYKIKKLTTLFEPAMIVFMGLIVGFVAIALISAMYGIFRQVQIS